MKTSLKWIAVSCLLLMLAGGCSSPASAPAPAVESKATLLVGAAAATINPEDGVFLAGYEQGRASTGVHDGLYAKAVVFDDGKTAVALVVLDAVSLQYPTVQHIREAASKTVQGLDLPPERIIVQATHTHCAPDTIGVELTEQDQDRLEKAVSTIQSMAPQMSIDDCIDTIFTMGLALAETLPGLAIIKLKTLLDKTTKESA